MSSNLHKKESYLNDLIVINEKIVSKFTMLNNEIKINDENVRQHLISLKILSDNLNIKNYNE